MARKFKTGDKVVVIKRLGPEPLPTVIGTKGIISDFDSDNAIYHYEVEIMDAQGKGNTSHYSARELKLLKRGNKKKS